MGHPPPIAALLLTVLGVGALQSQPAGASVLGPVLMLMRPQLEHRLASACVTARSGASALIAQL